MLMCLKINAIRFRNSRCMHSRTIKPWTKNVHFPYEGKEISRRARAMQTLFKKDRYVRVVIFRCNDLRRIENETRQLLIIRNFQFRYI